MEDTLESNKVLTYKVQIAKLSRTTKGKVIFSLNQYLTLDLLKEAYRLTRKSGAVGVDGQTADEYAKDLESNLKDVGTRFSRAIRSIKDYCRRNRHKPLVVQCKRLRSMIRGHYGYYGISGNFASIKNLHFIANKIWRKWLARRSRKSYINWDYYNKVIVKNYPLPKPKIVHKYN